MITGTVVVFIIFMSDKDVIMLQYIGFGYMGKYSIVELTKYGLLNEYKINNFKFNEYCIFVQYKWVNFNIII